MSSEPVPEPTGAVERYEFGRGGIVRRLVKRRGGSISSSEIRFTFDPTGLTAAETFDLAWLRSTNAPATATAAKIIRSVDLFAGCGGLSVGISEACRSLGLELWPVLANDIDPEVLSVYSNNMAETDVVCAPIEDLLDGECGGKLSHSERDLADRLGEVDIVVGGPPCQGHSDLNNHTRHSDPKNALYLRMARFCEVVRPRHVVIENVPGVERDKSRVAQRTWDRLLDLGYSVDSGVLDASLLGVAQKRRRSITIASREIEPSVVSAANDLEVKPRPLEWAIGDLRHVASGSAFDTPPNPNPVSRQRIDYLFDNGLYDLPDGERPDCHRLKPHSYTSVYGRLHWDRPAPTITTGFGSMGRGRFVHPEQRRTITPHEAARIQSFPDFFSFEGASRSLMHLVIGNAVPPKLGYAIGLHVLR